MLTTSLTRADASMSTFTTPRIYTCLTDATGRHFVEQDVISVRVEQQVHRYP
jgi:ABC-type uncharacterized transport system substrate-binding protein